MPSLGNPQEMIYPQRWAGLWLGQSVDRRSAQSRETFGRRFRRGRRPSPSAGRGRGASTSGNWGFGTSGIRRSSW